ncbi:hypothetical protein [Hymenobacter fodinae]|uniref:Uncharacterized protein n=1 Tax=Hymenobacter fodinae TaxID=2510796 RepID=A0A4Z0PAU3_9BACT|nr:hypothetical protein [Hymenobacter fodinae]TGE09735.1 hypothetical protein EU556_02575 [Hymenobacter fodinae]
MEALIQDTRRINSELVSLETAAELRATIQRNTADEATRQLLQKLAHDWPRIRPRLPLFLFQRLLSGMLMPLVVVTNPSSWLEDWGQNAAGRLVLKGLVLVLFWLLYKAGTVYLLRLIEP